MQPFLDKIAEQIAGRHQIENLKDVCVILPSRRATHFFKRSLASLSEKPFISPHIFAIDDFICQLSGLQIADPISLIFELFDVYSNQESEEVKFEDFVRWAPTVLKDFDLIDQYMVPDVNALFAYLDEAEALSRWSPDADTPLRITDNTAGYFSFYRTLAAVYHTFNQSLLEKEIAYRGRAYRLVAESLFDFLENEMPFEYFYFVGLNALSKSEKRIVTQLVHARKATCFWDTDKYYMNSDQQAGDVLRNYRDEGVFGPWNEPEDLLSNSTKSIEVLESPFETLQAKLASLLVSDKRTVFVVPDETMLQPVLFSLGEHMPEYNISMGLGMAYSKVSVLWSSVIDLHTLGVYGTSRGSRYHFDYVLRILNDPIVQEYERLTYGNDRPYKAFSDQVKTRNMVYLAEGILLETFPADGLIQGIFSSWKEGTRSLINCLRSLLSTLQESVLSSSDVLEKEFFMLLLSVINRLEAELRKHPDLSLEGVRALMAELSKQERVPFRGEQVADLQIMSLLETRCLDFEHVVFFSFNEGVIPSTQKNNSMLPYEVCKAFGIPVYADQDSIMAYHFYRLLTRAEKATLIYSSAGGGGLGARKEPSRFVLQLINQLTEVNPEIRLTQKQVSLRKEGEVPTDEIRISRKPEVLHLLKSYLLTKGLSASAINTYLNCELQFYLSKVLGINEQDQVQEVFGLDVFGNWMHYSIERISREVLGLNKRVTREKTLPAVQAAIPRILEEVFQEHFKGFEKDTGLNLIYERMARKSLLRYYEGYFFEGSEKRVLQAEYSSSSFVSVPTRDGDITLKLNGNIDSVELHNGNLFLLDYKTGSVDESDLHPGKNQSFQEALADYRKGKFRQITLYKYLIYREISEQSSVLGNLFTEGSPISAGMYSFQKSDKGLIASEDQIPLPVLKEEVENWLTNLVQGMLNPDNEIRQTSDEKNCIYCHFKELCCR